jgi:nicotinate dehydrogenase subunit A
MLARLTVAEEVTLSVNGAPYTFVCEPGATLLQVLRGPVQLAGPRFGCGLGACGACTVLLDGRPVTACDTPMGSVADSEVTTVEGLMGTHAGRALRDAFVAEQAGQCGYCLSGILVRSAALLADDVDQPRIGDETTIDEATVREALDQNLCRCGTHNRIVRAVLRAAAANRTSVSG